MDSYIVIKGKASGCPWRRHDCGQVVSYFSG